MQGTATEIRRFVIENFLFGDTSGALRDDESFLERGIIDSTGVLELVSFIERRFHVPFDDSDMVPENLDSILNLALFVERKTGLRAADAA